MEAEDKIEEDEGLLPENQQQHLLQVPNDNAAGIPNAHDCIAESYNSVWE